MISRLADRLDLHETFRTRDAARNAGYDAAARYAAGQFSADRVTEKRRKGEYEVIGQAAFVPEDLAWEPMLTIRRRTEPNKGATQTFDEETSPFRRNHFQSAEHAVTFALDYGERMIIGLVGGLKI